MRSFFGNTCYAVAIFGILAALVFFMKSGNTDADVDRDILSGLACLLSGAGLAVLSQKISSDTER